jgi:hemerythrin-like domain-containing protein
VPIKRDPSLIPLSHDHHHALVRVFEIRRALQANAGLAAEVTRTQDFFESDLKPHFRAEEEVLLPALARYVGEDDPMIVRLASDHRSLEAVVEELEREAGALAAFADSLEGHVRFEERELFQLYQEQVPEDERRMVEHGIRRILGREED